MHTFYQAVGHGNPLFTCAIAKKSRETVKIQLDSIAVVALDDLLKDAKRILPYGLLAKIQTRAQAILRVSLIERAQQKIVAVGIIHAITADGFQSALFRLGEDHGIWVDAPRVKTLQIIDPALDMGRRLITFFGRHHAADHRTHFRRIVQNLRVNAHQQGIHLAE